MKEIIINELFDSNEIDNYTVTNLNPKTKVPQFWLINVPGNNNLAVKMVSFLSRGDAIKQVKMGDKFAQVFFMSLSKSANGTNLKGGFGSDPLGALNTIFDTIYEQVKRLKMDALLFRFPSQKMKGQEKSIQRIIGRLAQQRTGGKFIVLEELYKFNDSRHSYILIYRKSKPIDSIAGIPEINAKLYTKVESKVGDVYIDDASGKQVTKLEAVAGSIAKQENERNEKSVISKSKVSRRVLMTTLYAITKPEDLQKYSSEAKEAFVKLQDNPPVYSSSDEVKSKTKNLVSDKADQGLSEIADMLTIADPDQIDSDYRWSVKNIRQAVDLVLHTEDVYIPAEELYTKTKPYILKLSEILKSDKGIVDKFKDISEYTIKYLPENISYEQKIKSVDKIVKAVANQYNDVISKLYKNLHDSAEYSKSEITAIRDYTNMDYEDINQFLLGTQKPSNSIINTTIPNLDNAFSKGVKLDKSTVLYRCQRHNYSELNKSVENKILYFPNFVSTTLKPIFFNNEFSNALVSSDKESDWELTSRLTMGDDIVDNIEQDKPSDSIARLGIMISGAHKVKVVVPGAHSRFPHEAEVILPRGSALKIKSVHGSGSLAKKFLIDTNYIAPGQIDESLEMYDGDKFLNEGVLEKIDFRNFVKNQEIIKERQSFEVSEAMTVLADIMVFDGIPEKFIQ